MSSISKNKKQSSEEEIVFPGDEIGVAEEFIPGTGAYEENGIVFASLFGKVKRDYRKKVVSVEALTKKIPELNEGDIIIGIVEEIKQQVAIVDIVKKKGEKRSLPGNLKGGIHISNIKHGFVKDISNELSVGDIIYAKVINTENNLLYLSIVDANLGVAKAFCKTCGNTLKLINKKLKCMECDKHESRKYAINYNNPEI